MSLNGSGVFLVSSTGQPVVANTLISASVFNAFASDVASALSTAVYKDGQQTITANLPMGGYKITGLGDASNAGEALRYNGALGTPSSGTLTNCTGLPAAGVSGTAVVATGTVPMTGLFKTVKGSDIASAATVDLGTATGNTVDVTHSTGTTAITSLGGASLQAGTEIETRFVITGGTLTLTHHATNLYLAGGADITLANGDVIRWRKMHSSNAEWKMVGGVKANGTAWATSMSTARLIGRTTAGTGAQEEITVGSGLSLSAGSLTATGSGITLGTPVASTSGTSIDFTSIPSGTKRITINFSGVSGNGTSNMLVQLGDSGGIENTGYSSGATNDNGTRVTSTAGFVIISATVAGSLFSGRVTLELLDAANFTWVSAGQLCETGSGMDGESGGSKSLSAELDRVRITTVGGTDTFDAGKINITYES